MQRSIAKRRGSFPNWEGSIWDTGRHMPMHDAALTTIAPTGSISIIAGCSSGIEPVYSLAYNFPSSGMNAIIRPAGEHNAFL